MRLPDSAYTERPWRTHEIASDFRVEDVWALPTPGGPSDLEKFAHQFTTQKEGESVVVNTLLELRWKLGGLIGLDRRSTTVGTRVESLRERLPADLRDGRRGPDFSDVPFRSVFLTDDEWLCEMANRTVHALMHVGWVRDESGDGYHGEMTALVKPNGWFGTVYMGGIMPIRRFLVYPMLIRSIRRQWRMQGAGTDE